MVLREILDINQFIIECQSEIDNDELFEMANIHDNIHGINDVVIWVGMANKQRGLRIKVSNTKNKFNINDHFVIQIPSLDYDPKQVASWITSKHIKKIFEWIKINQKLLFDYENGIISDTQKFLNDISRV